MSYTCMALPKALVLTGCDIGYQIADSTGCKFKAVYRYCSVVSILTVPGTCGPTILLGGHISEHKFL